MNAVVMADGWMKGGAEGARRGLADFWTAIGKQLPKEFISHGESDAIDLTSSSKWLAAWAAFFSPSQLNPFDLNLLRELLKNQVDFDGLRAFSPFKFFIGTTQAKSGKLRVLLEDELRLDALLASACLPKIHHAIEIDREPYWDGGYSANPAVFPLFYECDSRDVLLVLLTPLKHEGALLSVEEIASRILELAFSANFARLASPSAASTRACAAWLPPASGACTSTSRQRELSAHVGRREGAVVDQVDGVSHEAQPLREGTGIQPQGQVSRLG